MLENKELGLKIAEDKTEAKWQLIKDNSENKILEMKLAIEIEETVKKLAESKLKH